MTLEVKALATQIWQPEFNPCNPQRKERTDPTDLFLGSISVPWHAHPHTLIMQTHTQITNLKKLERQMDTVQYMV